MCCCCWCCCGETTAQQRCNVKQLLTSGCLLSIGLILGITVNYCGLVFRHLHVYLQVSAVDAVNTSHVLQQLDVTRLPGHHGNVTSLYVVPNIVHFIWLASNADRQLTFLNYISIVSAHRIQRPDAIYLHCNHLPAGPWWTRLWCEVPLRVVYRRPADSIHGQHVYHMYHRGDIAKIDILLRYGGIYLDYDVVVVNSLDPLRHFDATLGKEKPPKFIAGIMVARKQSTFLQLLYESYRDNYRPWDWDYNCARVAYQLYLLRPDLLHVEPYRLTTPDWKDRHKLWNEVINWRDLYVIHVMGHFHYADDTPDTIKTINSTFGEAMRYIYYGSPKLIGHRT